MVKVVLAFLDLIVAQPGARFNGQPIIVQEGAKAFPSTKSAAAKDRSETSMTKPSQ